MFKQAWHLIKEGFAAFIRDEALTRGAAIACVARRLSRRDLEVFLFGTAMERQQA